MKYKAALITAALLIAPLAYADDHGGRPGMMPQVRGEAGARVEMHDRMMGSTTNDGRPPLRDGEDDRGDRDHMMASSSDRDHMMGTSTEDRPAPHGLFLGIFKRFFGGNHDNGQASTTPPQMRGEGGMMASSSIEASTTVQKPGFAGFIQNFFGRFFH